MEFGGTGLASLSMDERATLCNMATECSAKTGICEPDQLTINWLLERREDLNEEISVVRLYSQILMRTMMEAYT